MNQTEQRNPSTVEVVTVEQPKQEAAQVIATPAMTLKTGIRAGFAQRRSAAL